MIDADVDKLEQVFFNLITNSMNFISSKSKSGSIYIRARIIPENKMSHIVINFEDDGPGIPTEIREKIFDRGFSTIGGTGVGLAIVKSIILSHGGTIVVHQPRSRGANFLIKLPQKRDIVNSCV